jgi:hypothetical protein
MTVLQWVYPENLAEAAIDTKSNSIGGNTNGIG